MALAVVQLVGAVHNPEAPLAWGALKTVCAGARVGRRERRRTSIEGANIVGSAIAVLGEDGQTLGFKDGWCGQAAGLNRGRGMQIAD